MASIFSRVRSFLASRRAAKAQAGTPDRNNPHNRPQSETRWYLADVELAELAADTGDLSTAARLMRSAQKDGVYRGAISTRTDGLVRLPKVWFGDRLAIEELELGYESATSQFDRMFPASELSLLAKDGIELGVGFGQLVHEPHCQFPAIFESTRECDWSQCSCLAPPVFVRCDPEWLRYDWLTNGWRYRTTEGEKEVIPGAAGGWQWILHTPGGRRAPWQNGTWKAIAKAFVRKEYAATSKDNWEATRANSALVAKSPKGEVEPNREVMLKHLAEWGQNPVYMLTQGWELDVLETNGQGAKSFSDTIKAQNEEMILATNGQTITTLGGKGFENSGVFQAVRADLIKATGDSLAQTLNTQGLPVFSRWFYCTNDVRDPVAVAWDISPPKDRATDASTAVQVASAIKALREALAPEGLKPDVAKMCAAFGIPVVKIGAAEKVTPLKLVAKNDN